MEYHGIYAQHPPELTPVQEQLAIQNLETYALSKGLAVKPHHSSDTKDGQVSGLAAGAISAPLTLYPSLFPQSCFREALNIQSLYNTLYTNIARDEQWLQHIVSPLAQLDGFVGKLWQIHSDLRANNAYTQSLSLGLFRSDYMTHFDKSSSQPQIRQVEFNTVAASFAGLSYYAGQVHRHLIARESYGLPCLSDRVNLPDNISVVGLAAALKAGHEAYHKAMNPSRKTCIVFIVQPNERNVFDQTHLQNQLSDDHGLRVFRVAFPNVLSELKVEQDSTLTYADPATNRAFEVSLVYYRAGYAPDEYTTLTDWHTRAELERSKAIKCPSILLQLAGMKKVQQVLATSGSTHVERFLPTASVQDLARLRATFAPMYPLDDTPVGKQGRQLALDPATAKNFVLKPQREGGGNNIYREAIPAFLKQRPVAEWDAFVLMQMIEPPRQKNTILMQGIRHTGDVICELGIYGACLYDTQEQNEHPTLNTTIPYLLRTKSASSLEGGVAAGFGSLDSVLLVPDEAFAVTRE